MATAVAGPTGRRMRGGPRPRGATAVRVLRRVLHAAGWVILILAVTGMTWAVGIERWSDRWGATDGELAAELAGDGLIEQPALVTTRAVTVRAPADRVWPWVAQFGQGRGGLYSYDWLERMVGIDMVSADTILPAEQDVVVGDQIWITQPGYPADLGLVVAEVQPGRALVLAVSTPNRPSAPEDAPWTWAFVLEPQGDGSTRLIVRNRNATMGPVGDAIWDRIVGPIGFAMERKTMSGIAQRAEAAVGSDVDQPWRESVWFGALLVTGAAILVIAGTPAPVRRRAGYIVGFTAAATLVLFRFPSAIAAVVLSAAAALVATLLWRAWPSTVSPARCEGGDVGDREEHDQCDAHPRRPWRLPDGETDHQREEHDPAHDLGDDRQVTQPRPRGVEPAGLHHEDHQEDQPQQGEQP